MSIKKIILVTAISASIALPALSHAMDSLAPSTTTGSGLTIVNNTDEDSTSIINTSLCSDRLPLGKGITKRRDPVTKTPTVNTIDSSLINFACMANKTQCKAVVYMTNNCSGPVVAQVVFDTEKGVQSVAESTDKYKFTWEKNAFSARIDYIKE